MTRCYECDKEVDKLIWKGRCCDCVVKRLEANLKENDDLREEINVLEQELAYEKDIDRLLDKIVIFEDEE